MLVRPGERISEVNFHTSHTFITCVVCIHYALLQPVYMYVIFYFAILLKQIVMNSNINNVQTMSWGIVVSYIYI